MGNYIVNYLETRPPEHDGCEFDPETGQAAYEDSKHYLTTRAAWVVGGGYHNWRLCEDCAKLKRFARFSKRKEIKQ